MDAEDIYYALREKAEQFGFVSDYADEVLADAAQAIADHPDNNE